MVAPGLFKKLKHKKRDYFFMSFSSRVHSVVVVVVEASRGATCSVQVGTCCQLGGLVERVQRRRPTDAHRMSARRAVQMSGKAQKSAMKSAMKMASNK